MQWSQYCWW